MREIISRIGACHHTNRGIDSNPVAKGVSVHAKENIVNSGALLIKKVAETKAATAVNA